MFRLQLRRAPAAFSGSRLISWNSRFHVRTLSSSASSPQAVLETAVLEGHPPHAPDQEESAGNASQPEEGPSPAQADRDRFRLHWSVDMWRDFDSKKWLEGSLDGSSPLPNRMRKFAETLASAFSTAGVLESSEAATFWAYHTARTGFFTLQGLVGLFAARSVSSNAVSSNSTLSRMEAIVRDGVQGPISEALLAYYQDYENIKEGRYALPWDMTTPTHRQYNPVFVLRNGAKFVREAVDTLRRRERGTPDPLWMRSAYLPDYFQSTFHYQTDGWMSQRSASVYPTSTETLFVGRQDSMQRCALVPISEFMAGRDAAEVRTLEVACGTGRFATFLKDNYPAMDLTLSDLSPFYLAEARSNMRYWKSKRAANLSDFGGPDGNMAAFYQTAAEGLDFPDVRINCMMGRGQRGYNQVQSFVGMTSHQLP